MRITTEYWPPPIPDRRFDWSAIDADSYDGAEDSSIRSQVGHGRTKAEAIADLLQILADADEETAAYEAQHRYFNQHESPSS
jgi:hypothetical protein